MTLTVGESAVTREPDVSHTVPARAWSDDEHIQVGFDAQRWLLTATIDAVVKLANDGWERGNGADAVALHSQEWDEGCATLQEYVTARCQAADIVNAGWIGYECCVSRPHALTWLKSNRPGVYDALMARGLA